MLWSQVMTIILKAITGVSCYPPPKFLLIIFSESKNNGQKIIYKFLSSQLLSYITKFYAAEFFIYFFS